MEKVETVTDLSIYTLGFNLHPDMGYEPLQDVVLRQAIAYAIDKQNIVDVAMGGFGEVEYSWTYNESPNLNPDLTKYDYDTTEAASILTAAGYTKHA
jgi:peptide/nickel transport system substrate-binding protein